MFLPSRVRQVGSVMGLCFQGPGEWKRLRMYPYSRAPITCVFHWEYMYYQERGPNNAVLESGQVESLSRRVSIPWTKPKVQADHMGQRNTRTNNVVKIVAYAYASFCLSITLVVAEE